MIKAAAHTLSQRSFPSMPEGGMTKIVPKRDGLRKVLIKTQAARNSSCNLTDLKSVRKSCTVMVTVRGKKNLCFMLKPSEAFAVNYSVPVPLKIRSQITFADRKPAPFRFRTQLCRRCQPLPLSVLKFFAQSQISHLLSDAPARCAVRLCDRPYSIFFKKFKNPFLLNG